jgi:hypothetical protein
MAGRFGVASLRFANMSPLFAGMASPLPLETEFVQRLNNSVEYRLQAISFFLLALLLCTLVVWGLWNYLRRDLTFLPRLSFGKALAGVILWGLLVFVVLTMISGARELMTPGAWKKDGFTYKLADDPVESRRMQMERLRTSLWEYAALHQGRFPPKGDSGDIPDELWNVPDGAGLRFHYVPGQYANKSPEMLVVEPELDAARRWVLLTNGDIVAKSTAEIQSQRKSEGRP